jgi:hypothetical protein
MTKASTVLPLVQATLNAGGKRLDHVNVGLGFKGEPENDSKKPRDLLKNRHSGSLK